MHQLQCQMDQSGIDLVSEQYQVPDDFSLCEYVDLLDIQIAQPRLLIWDQTCSSLVNSQPSYVSSQCVFSACKLGWFVYRLCKTPPCWRWWTSRLCRRTTRSPSLHENDNWQQWHSLCTSLPLLSQQFHTSLYYQREPQLPALHETRWHSWTEYTYAFNMVVRWHKLGEVENKQSFFSLLSLCQKIFTIGQNLTKFWQKISLHSFLRQCVFTPSSSSSYDWINIIYKNQQFLHNIVCILKLWNFWITFFTFFWNAASKKRKKSRFWIFKKNVKTYSRTMTAWLDTILQTSGLAYDAAYIRRRYHCALFSYSPSFSTRPWHVPVG